MTQATKDNLTRLIPWIVAVLLAIGSAVMTLQYSEDRIERLESWQLSHAAGTHSDTERDLALAAARIERLESSDEQIAQDVSDLRGFVFEIRDTTNALCNASTQCRQRRTR